MNNEPEACQGFIECDGNPVVDGEYCGPCISAKKEAERQAMYAEQAEQDVRDNSQYQHLKPQPCEVARAFVKDQVEQVGNLESNRRESQRRIATRLDERERRIA